MELELLIKLAARIRCMNEREFLALKLMIDEGHEDDEMLPQVTQCLSDLIDISEAHRRGWRIIPQVAAVA